MTLPLQREAKAARGYIRSLLGRCPHCGSTSHTKRARLSNGWLLTRIVCNDCGRTVRGY